MVNLGLKSTQVDKFPDGILERQLVEHGGTAFLIDKGLLVADTLNIAIATDIAAWGTEFGGFQVSANGPKKTVLFAESALFADGSADTTVTFDLVPMDIRFRVNAFFTDWVDGQQEIQRGKMLVDPIVMKKKLSDCDSRPWCYWLLVVAVTNARVQLVVQAVQLTMGAIMSSPWSDTANMGGVILTKFEATWFPALSPACSHTGPAPYLVDRRAEEVSHAKTMPTSQAYRDMTVTLLSLAVCPAEMGVEEISSDSLSTRKEPVRASLYRFAEMAPESGGSQ